MSYFADLSPYTYSTRSDKRVVVNVGWLDAAIPFHTGSEKSERFLKTLKGSVVSRRMHATRGFHDCPFCRSARGSAEVWFDGPKRTYAAPELIAHYVENHKYCPPQEFIDAVLAYGETSEHT